MNAKTWITTLAVAALAGEMLAARAMQSAPAPEARQKDAAVRPFDLHKLDAVLGTDVKGPKNNDVAKIDDIVLGADGMLDYAVLSIGGVAGIGDAKRLLPWRDLQLSARDNNGKSEVTARVTMTEEQLKALRPFDEKNLPASTVSAGSTAGGTARPAGGADGKGAPTDGMSPPVVCAKKVDGHKVLGANNDSVGEIEDIVLDLADTRVAFVVLGAGGTLGIGEKHLALPWNALQFQREANGDLVIHSNLSKERLTNAPEYDDKRWTDMRGPTWLGTVYEFYKVDPYWPNAARPMNDKKPENTGGDKKTGG